MPFIMFETPTPILVMDEVTPDFAVTVLEHVYDLCPDARTSFYITRINSDFCLASHKPVMLDELISYLVDEGERTDLKASVRVFKDCEKEEEKNIETIKAQFDKMFNMMRDEAEKEECPRKFNVEETISVNEKSTKEDIRAGIDKLESLLALLRTMEIVSGIGDVDGKKL